MSQKKLPRRPKMDARIILVVPAEMKRGLFELAARCNRSAADLARDGIASIVASAS